MWGSMLCRVSTNKGLTMTKIETFECWVVDDQGNEIAMRLREEDAENFAASINANRRATKAPLVTVTLRIADLRPLGAKGPRKAKAG